MLAIVQPWHTPRVFFCPDGEMIVEAEGTTTFLIAYVTIDQDFKAQERSWVQTQGKSLRKLNDKFLSYVMVSKEEVSKAVRTRQKSLYAKENAKRPRKEARLEDCEVAETEEKAGATTAAVPAICDRERGEVASSSPGDDHKISRLSLEVEKTVSTTSTELELSSRSRSACSLQPMQNPEATRTRGDFGLWNNCIWP